MLSIFSSKKDKEKTVANHIDREKIENMLVKYPDKIPVVLKVSDQKIKLSQKKFLIPNDLSVAQFMFTIRKRMTLSPTDAIFIYFNDKDMANQSEIIQAVYERCRNPIDKILYVTIATENTFG
jgi:hypothetical protein